MAKCCPKIQIIVRPEDSPVRGNAIASGDDKVDKETEDYILQELEDGNIWAWCCIEVRASFRGISGSDYLGQCSYVDETEFRQGGYFEDMVNRAVEELSLLIADLQGVEINTCDHPVAVDAEVLMSW